MNIKFTALMAILVLGLYSDKTEAWSAWSSCSATCGHGTRTRYQQFEHFGRHKEYEDCNNVCNNGGIIQNNRCVCPAGTTGTCCDDIPECASNPCQNGGTCIEMINCYNCSCTSRFYGLNCENDLMWEHYSTCQFKFNRCFRIFRQSFLWYGAQEFCRRRNGHLAVLDTPEKQYFMETSLKALENSFDFWIGASSNGNALPWITGGNVINNRWPPGVSAGIHGYGCLALSSQYNFMWTELYCVSTAYYI